MECSQGPGIVAGGLFFIFWLFMMGGMIVGWIFFLVAMWRGMKAHESVAESLKQIVQK
jgi:hypothetical protein